MKSKEKINTVVFFEDISWFHYPLIKYYLYRGYEIFVFDFEGNLKKRKWLQDIINNERVKRLYIKMNTGEDGEAIDQTEIISSHFEKTSLYQIIADLFQSDETHIVFKKVLVKEIFKCIYINRYLSQIEKSFDKPRVVLFIPKDYKIYERLIKKYGAANLAPLPKVKYYSRITFFLYISNIYNKVECFSGIFLYVFAKLFLLIIGKLKARKFKKPVYFQNAIPINAYYQLENAGARGFDFLLDDDKINLQNTLFIVNIPISRAELSPYKEKGYIFTNLLEMNKGCSLINYDCAFMASVIMASLKMFACWDAPLSLIFACSISIKNFIKWRLFFQHFHIRNYIYTGREDAAQLIINILVRQQSGRTWDYSIFLGGGYIDSKDIASFNDCRHILWSFLNPDYFLVMNEDVVSYYKLHHQKVREYCPMGSIYSEMIRKEMLHLNREDFIDRHFTIATKNDKKIITFFDTTFIDSPEVPTTFQDGIEFYQDILKLLQDRKELLIIIKPSKTDIWFISPEAQWSSLKKGSTIVSLWNELRANPRVFWVGQTKNKKVFINFTYNNIAIAVSDVIVTHCMSSPTAEALGARKKAIWYESSDKHRGIMYDKIPGLCVHGYNELIERLNYLLYNVTDDEYNVYLDKYVKGKVEAHLDGLALTRFRNLLDEKENKK